MAENENTWGSLRSGIDSSTDLDSRGPTLGPDTKPAPQAGGTWTYDTNRGGWIFKFDQE